MDLILFCNSLIIPVLVYFAMFIFEMLEFNTEPDTEVFNKHLLK